MPASGGPNLLERIVFGKVSSTHLATFCRQLAAYLDAGVDVRRSLDSLGTQFQRTALGPVIERLGQAVRRGDDIASAVAREPQAFDPLFLSMIRVAEARGGVPETLRTLSQHYEARVRLIRQARSAMIYPIAVLIIALGVVFLLTLFVLPAMISALELDRANLPLPTTVLIAFTRFMQAFGWWLVPLLMIGGFFGLVRLYRTASGKAAMDEIALRVPVLGKLLRLIDTTRFARTLGALVEGGVDIVTSLDLTADVMRLAPFRRMLQKTKQAVVDGSELSEALAECNRFSPDVIAIVNTGEETGKLPESLRRLADDYEEQVTYMVKNLGNLIQPLIYIMMGGIVLFIILAVLIPYISWIMSMSRG